MGWIGPANRVLDALRARGADKDERGLYLIVGGGAVGLGGEEVVLADDACYLKDGKRELLVPVLYGGVMVTVI